MNLESEPLKIVFNNGLYAIGYFFEGKGYDVYDLKLPGTDPAEPGRFIKGTKTYLEALDYVRGLLK